MALLNFANSASAQITITSTNQNGQGTNYLYPLTWVPTWVVPQSSSASNPKQSALIYEKNCCYIKLFDPSVTGGIYQDVGALQPNTNI